MTIQLNHRHLPGSKTSLSVGLFFLGGIMFSLYGIDTAEVVTPELVKRSASNIGNTIESTVAASAEILTAPTFHAKKPEVTLQSVLDSHQLSLTPEQQPESVDDSNDNVVDIGPPLDADLYYESVDTAESGEPIDIGPPLNADMEDDFVDFSDNGELVDIGPPLDADSDFYPYEEPDSMSQEKGPVLDADLPGYHYSAQDLDDVVIDVGAPLNAG